MGPKSFLFEPMLGGPVSVEYIAREVIKPTLQGLGMEWHGWHAFRRGLATKLAFAWRLRPDPHLSCCEESIAYAAVTCPCSGKIMHLGTVLCTRLCPQNLRAARQSPGLLVQPASLHRSVPDCGRESRAGEIVLIATTPVERNK